MWQWLIPWPHVSILHGLISLVGARNFLACAGRETRFGHYRQNFHGRRQNVGDTNQITELLMVSACCRLSCFSQSQWQKVIEFCHFCIVLWAIPNFHSIAQVLACRGRDWRLRTTLLCEPPLNVIIGWVMYKAGNLLHTAQPPNDSILATCSDNHYTLSAVLQIHEWQKLCPCL